MAKLYAFGSSENMQIGKVDTRSNWGPCVRGPSHEIRFRRRRRKHAFASPSGFTAYAVTLQVQGCTRMNCQGLAFGCSFLALLSALASRNSFSQLLALSGLVMYSPERISTILR